MYFFVLYLNISENNPQTDLKFLEISSNNNPIIMYKFSGISLTEKNYWADNSYYSDLEVTIYGQ